MVNARNDLATGMKPGFQHALWAVSDGPVAYPTALAAWDARAAAIAAGSEPELVWPSSTPLSIRPAPARGRNTCWKPGFPFIPPVAAGNSPTTALASELPMRCSTGGIAGRTSAGFVANLEEWIIRTLAIFNVRGERREERWRVGATARQRREPGRKIAAVGIRLKRWISLHGIAINVGPDLTHFSGIVPCGVTDPHHGVTSLVDLGHEVTMAEVDEALKASFEDLFGPTTPVDGNRIGIGIDFAPAASP